MTNVLVIKANNRPDGISTKYEVIVECHAQDPKNAPTIIAEGLEKVKETAEKL
ncbi:hypothetical protein [Peribacillus frigoritolerans]|uniref:hypothetical protein n=1 Tax=Peribacillus castrilensis TaxID=2897690 RepID=UPI00296F57CF|nr:hypothetical protein [Peribacillus castrilensis]